MRRHVCDSWHTFCRSVSLGIEVISLKMTRHDVCVWATAAYATGQTLTGCTLANTPSGYLTMRELVPDGAAPERLGTSLCIEVIAVDGHFPFRNFHLPVIFLFYDILFFYPSIPLPVH